MHSLKSFVGELPAQAPVVRDDAAPLGSPYRIVCLVVTHLRCRPCSCGVAVANRTVVRGRCAPPADHFGPVFGRVGPVFSRVGPVCGSVFGSVLGRVGPVCGRVGFAAGRVECASWG